MVTKERSRTRDLPPIHIGNHRIVERTKPIKLDKKVLKELAEIIEKNRVLKEKEYRE